MSAVNAPFGLKPVRVIGQDNLPAPTAVPNGIPSGYGTAILQNQPVAFSTTGAIIAYGGTGPLLGTFQGVEFIDSTGRKQVLNRWPAGQTLAANTVATVFVTRDPTIVYEIQASGSLAQSSIGDQASFSAATAGSTVTGYSQAMINTTLAGAGNTAQLRILELAPYSDNAWGDAFTVVRVQIAAHQEAAQAVAY